MTVHRSDAKVTVLLDIAAIIVSFVIAVGVRFSLLLEHLGSVLIVSTYVLYLAIALALYVIICMAGRSLRVERLSYKEIITVTIEQQIIFIAAYVVLFFLFHKYYYFSRVVVVLFFIGNIVLCSAERILYHNYCIKKNEGKESAEVVDDSVKAVAAGEKKDKQHVYIIGAKSIGLYGGYESFVLNLLQQHKDNKEIKYHVACKANGQGYMNLDKLPEAVRINDSEFSYCNAHCFMIKIPEKIGSAQAIYYDIKALQYCCEHIEKNHIEHPIVYILASRIGPFERKYVRRIHEAGGKVAQNPDGHEDWRRKWHFIIRKYWKFSEEHAVKNADLVICDSKNIESYIQDEYAKYHPKTTFIAYGSYITPSNLADDAPKYTNWLTNHNLRDGEYYISVGRFVEENNFEIMIREFMLSNTQKDFAIITTENPKYAEQLEQKLHYKKDKRIKFVGTVYDQELLAKIRTNAYGYFHGHEVGGTNPSLLESLGSTKLNLLYEVGFNKEVAEDAALYWSKDEGDLAKLIDKADAMATEDRELMGEKAKKRIREEYSWENIANKYEKAWIV